MDIKNSFGGACQRIQGSRRPIPKASALPIFRGEEMKTRIKTNEEETDYGKIKQIKFAKTEEEVQALMLDGFKIFHIGGQHLDTNGFNSKPLIIMGRE